MTHATPSPESSRSILRPSPEYPNTVTISKHFIAVLVVLVATLAHVTAQESDGPVELRNARAAYQQQIKALTDPVRLRYAQTLETLKRSLGARGDVQGALAIQREIEGLGLAQPPTPATGPRDEARLIIWNQNNGGKGDRGTRKINVILRAGEKEIWRRNDIHMSWDKTKQEKEVIPVPFLTLVADTIRIEITETVNERGGLAEVEYFKDGKNVALGCTVTASGYWENNEGVIPAKLTDGSPDSHWLLPDKTLGWAEINLRKRK